MRPVEVVAEHLGNRTGRLTIAHEVVHRGNIAVERGFVDVLLIRGQVLLTRECRDAWHPVVEDGINGHHRHSL